MVGLLVLSSLVMVSESRAPSTAPGSANDGSLRDSATVSNLSATPNPTDAGLSTQFTWTGGTSAYSYAWIFGDGTAPVVGTSPEESHTYTTEGTYTAEAWQNESGNSNFSSVSVTVNPPLQTPTLSATPNPTDAGLATEFTLTGGGGGTSPYSYAWRFGDGTGTVTSTSSAESHTYSAAGTYTAVAWQNDSLGVSSSASTSVTVSSLTATLSASPNPTDAGVSTEFTLTGSGGIPPYTYAWIFGDGSGTVTGSSSVENHTYAAAGTYPAEAWRNDSLGVSSFATTSVSVNGELQTPTLEVSPNPTDVGVSIRFNTTVSEGTRPYTYSYSGLPTGCTSSNVSDLTCLPTAAGTFTTTVTVQDSAGNTSSATTVVVVNPDPKILDLTATPTPANVDEPVVFATTVANGTQPFTYAWSFGDGVIADSAVPTITHNYTSDGPFRANLTVTDSLGVNASASITISTTMSVAVSANVTLGATPLPVAFTSRISGGLPSYTYAWAFGDGTASNVADPSHVYTSAGNYTATLVVTDSEGNVATASESITVYPGGGTLTVRLEAAPSTLALGASSTVTMIPSGGTGSYTVLWTSLPAGCSQISPLVQTCTPTGYGTFSVTGEVSDSLGQTANSSASFTVSPSLYAVTFAESGLPSGTHWSVTLNGTVQSSTGRSMVFSVANGTLNYTVAPNGSWIPSPSQGNVTVAGSTASVSVGFTFTYVLSFVRPADTPSGTVWSVSLSGPNVLRTSVLADGTVTANSTGPSIQLREPNGTYTYTITVVGYPSYSATGPVTVRGTSPTVTPPSFLGTSPSGLGNALNVPVYLIYGGAAAIAVALIVLVLLARRRRDRPPEIAPPTGPVPPGSG